MPECSPDRVSGILGSIHCIVDAVATIAREGIATVEANAEARFGVEHRMRSELKRLYSHDLINNLVANLYTKVQFAMRDHDISRITATKYLDPLAGAGILSKAKAGRSRYHINVRLLEILTAAPAGFTAVTSHRPTPAFLIGAPTA